MAITQVFERLYLGSADDAERLATSNSLGITAVINVGTEKNQAKREGVIYIHIPLLDAQPVQPAVLEQVLAAISQNIRNGKALIHCGAGMSRGPVMVAAYMHRIGYKHFTEALLELQQLRPIVDPARCIFESVKDQLRAGSMQRIRQNAKEEL